MSSLNHLKNDFLSLSDHERIVLVRERRQSRRTPKKNTPVRKKAAPRTNTFGMTEKQFKQLAGKFSEGEFKELLKEYRERIQKK